MKVRIGSRKSILSSATAAVALALLAPSARAGLAINWVGDDYAGSGTWASNATTGSLSITATTGGANVPTSVPNAFGTHTGVAFAAGNAYFDVPAGTTPINQNPANFTVAVAFKASGPAATSGGSFFNGQMIFGND